jgi:methionine-rich copper-binding protein CopC
MRRRGVQWSALLLPVLAAIVQPGLDARAAEFHITLDKSVPADGETVTGDVREIRLFLSGAPLMRGASVRIVTSGRQLMRSSPPAADPADPKQIFVQVDPPLPPGAYVVQWRCIADDGHVMRGDFTFEVATEAAAE